MSLDMLFPRKHSHDFFLALIILLVFGLYHFLPAPKRSVSQLAQAHPPTDPGGGAIDPPPPAVCGNGVRETGEICDGVDLNNESCKTRGYSAGNLSCAADCQSFNVTQCTNTPPPPPGCTPVSSDPQGLANGGSVLFVDGSNCGCSDNNSRATALNPTTPWCSPQGFNEAGPGGSKLNPSDTVYIRRGDYHALDVRVDTSNITIKSYPGESPTIRGSSPSWKQMFSFYNLSNLTIDGLNFLGWENVSGGRLYVPIIVSINGVSNVNVRNSTFGAVQGSDDIGFGGRFSGSESYKNSWGTALKFSNINGGTVSNVDISCTDSLSKNRIDQLSADGLLCDSCRSMTIRDSRFGDCGHVSLSLRNSTDVTVERNTLVNRFHTAFGINEIEGNPGVSSNITVRNNSFHDYNQTPSESNLRGGGVQIGPGNMSNLLIYNNLFYNGHNDSTGITLYGGTSGTLSNNKIFYNTMYQPGSRGIYLTNAGLSPGSNRITGTKVYDNLVADVKAFSAQNAGYLLNAEMVLVFSNLEEGAGYGNDFKNNLLYSSAGNQTIKSLNIIGGGQLDPRHNYTATTFNTLSFADSNIAGNPLFVSAGGDFHLQSASPAGNAGLCQAEVSSDYDGRSRSTTGCDIGAFESNQTQTAIIPPLATCGNNQLDAGEECDGSLLSSKFCSALGYISGNLSCTAGCHFDTNQCLGFPTATTTRPVATSTTPLPLPPGTICGNGIIERGEQCDSANFAGASCRSLGLAGGGTLKCFNRFALQPCRYDVRSCLTTPTSPKPTTPSTPPAVKPAGSGPVSPPTPKPSAPPEPAGCQEHWFCQESWSGCVGGIQTRTCVDLRNCGTTLNRPTIEQACISSATATSSAPQTLSEFFHLDDDQGKTLAVLVPTFLATLAILLTVIVRLFI